MAAVRDSEAGKIFIGGLSYNTTDESLTNYFIRFGEIKDSVVMKELDGKPRRFGFITYADPNSAEVALGYPQGSHVVDGKVVNVTRGVGWEDAFPLSAKYIGEGDDRSGSVALKDYQHEAITGLDGEKFTQMDIDGKTSPSTASDVSLRTAGKSSNEVEMLSVPGESPEKKIIRDFTPDPLEKLHVGVGLLHLDMTELITSNNNMAGKLDTFLEKQTAFLEKQTAFLEKQSASIDTQNKLGVQLAAFLGKFGPKPEKIPTSADG